MPSFVPVGPASPSSSVRDRAGARSDPFRLHAPVRPPWTARVAPSTLLYVGTGDVSLTARVDDEPARSLCPGTSMLVPPAARVHLEAADAAPDAAPGVVALVIDREAVWHLTDRMPPSPGVGGPALTAGLLPVCVSHPAAVDRALRGLAALTTEAPPHRDVLVELTATQLVVGLLPTAAGALLRRGESAALTPGLADALRVVHRHLHRPLSVDELAEAACMSRATFYRHFRSALGVTPLQYVIRVRMGRACTLLRAPDRTVTAVALDLGFRSVSHFITTFKKHVGTTPRAYQRRSGRARRLSSNA